MVPINGDPFGSGRVGLEEAAGEMGCLGQYIAFSRAMGLSPYLMLWRGYNASFLRRLAIVYSYFFRDWIVLMAPLCALGYLPAFYNEMSTIRGHFWLTDNIGLL